VHLSPICVLSALAPPVLPGTGDLAWLPSGAVAVLQGLAERLFLDPAVAPGLNRVRARLGLSPVSRIMSRWMHSPDMVIAAWPAWFAAPQADWPPHAVVTSFPFWNRAEAAVIDPALEGFLQDGAPPVGITPGSAMAHGRSFFAAALQACQALGRRALLITPYADQLPALLPPGCHHVVYAPFESVVPRLAALIHHGGIGTSAQALAAGVPQLVYPFAHDQFDNAARLKRLNLGRVVVRRASARLWVDALACAVDDEAVRAACRDRATAMAGSVDGVTLIADQLETLASKRQAT
jgi:rhamnosyltransferase subunit B